MKPITTFPLLAIEVVQDLSRITTLDINVLEASEV
jgi:hypothetical protein